MNYVIVTPVRDEEQHIAKTIESVISQSILPSQWVIVNDGSTDKTGSIIDEYAKKHSWIVPVHRTNRGFRKAGGGVIEAFYDGFERITTDFEFIIKLDGDLSFQKNYFEKCFEHFDSDQSLGIGGGEIISIVNNEQILEKNPKFHVRGATKIYRKKCWNDIEFLLKAPGWDTLDEVKANMKGWKTYSFPELILTQHKFTGAADGFWKDLKKNGRANYICGYHPLFFTVKCLRRLTWRPYIIGAVALFWGYLSSFLKHEPQINDKPLIHYLRKQQLKKLLLRPSIWK